MTLFVDTNVLIAATVGEPDRGAIARDFLDSDHDFATTLLNVMEFRTVLTKKKHFEQERVEQLLDGLFDRMDVYGPETGDLIEAYALQQDTLLYTMDCVILATANEVGAQLVTFDTELLENGALSPEEILE
ncbi:PIN domain-containing protein [Natronoglomus mannanivorans]|uniref:Ribonuclease VapC n=1 Tax=Natronoglomus mannanivorans TaxID=2979990 RepID=A0AAP2Z3R5_9EURY|nr:PIN domain-containing protein [Halobacteria archaeon AArc-xg1-1]